MTKMIGIIQPFDLKQQFFIYQNGKKEKTFSIQTETLSSDITKILIENNIKQLDLTGPKSYISGFKHQIETQMITLYNNYNLKINLI